MGSFTASNISGQGSVSLGGLVPAAEFVARLVTPGFFTNFAGPSPVRRTHQIGWIGLTEPPGPFTGPIVVWHTFVENEYEDKPIVYAPGNDPDTLWWDLTPGTVINVVIYW